MKELDDELRHALRREEPPAGLAERVLRRVADGRPPQQQMRRPRRFIAWAAAAALVAAVAGGIQYRAIQEDREERARGEAAKEQVVQALRLAGSKLQLVQTKIKGIGS
jgi:hypothetical protein